MGPRDEYHKFLYKVKIYPSFYLAVLHLYQLNRFDMINEISKIPQKSFFSRSSMSIIYLWSWFRENPAKDPSFFVFPEKANMF